MSIRKFLATVAVSVFLIGTLATANVFAGGWKPIVEDHETRIGNLETNDAAQDSQLGDHETRLGDAETRLGTVEQNQTDLQSDVDDLGARVTELENQSPAVPLSVYDGNNNLIGTLVNVIPRVAGSAEPHLTVYVPEVEKFIELKLDGTSVSDSFNLDDLWYATTDCDSGIPEVDKQYYGYPLLVELAHPYFISSHTDCDGNIRFYTVGDWQSGTQLQSRNDCDLISYPDGCAADSPPVGAYPLTPVTLPFTLPLTPPISFK